ncbi:enoyl-CoA hydratase [Jatrophihabitans cynanchi]|uniref:Enoyl-CoA hydratase n=1 Tax=Jatrophihabitans cynanchi TaxID=2944128 RepID=A0ABY7K1A7_9ACTN|nr:enoyl-CoA hydratase [Jatrophihabitans sp. SB3-54]WAX58459.1 enoyl-CoA hydratase [Jatrophihabitans sp. SB3-54]
MIESSEPVLVDVSDRTATVTLNRGASRNALSAQLRSTLAQRIRELDEDPGIDVLILTGVDPAFCAGLDLKELASGAHDIADSVGKPDRSQVPLPPTRKPLIGAINGAAVTGGLELALLCDFLVASERARFADTHMRIGVHPGWGLTVLLPQAVGLRRAKELSTTGRYLDAATARDWGLVNHVVEHDELLPYCRQLATAIVSNDAAGVRAILQTYDAGAEITVAEAWVVEAYAARHWLTQGGGRADEIATRRAAVQAWGRAQAGD